MSRVTMFKDRTANFERAVFFSWYCRLRDCKFCYMSTQKDAKEGKFPRRRTESILTEVLITKKLGWDLGFLSGGIGAYKNSEFKALLEKVYLTWGDKFWLSAGPLTKKELVEYQPYIKGVVGSLETVNEALHKELCPSKPAEPYFRMFEEAKRLGIKSAVTIILGMGESIGDFSRLKEIIEKYDVSKVHFYALNPHKGTIFEGKESPSAEYQAEWIRKTRQSFPDIDIQCGIWEDKVDRTGVLLKAGADSISKYPALKYFGSGESRQLEEEIAKSGFRLMSSLTRLPDAEWDREVESLPFDDALKEKIKVRVKSYLRMMGKDKSHKKAKRD